MKYLVLTACLLAVSLAAPQNDKGLSEDELKTLTKKGDIPVEQSLRCGMFFAGELDAEPIERMFVFNFTWAAPECPSQVISDSQLTICADLFKKLLPGFEYTNPSIRKELRARGDTMGDDVCGLLQKRYKVPFVGSKQNSKRFPNGLMIGMYANICGNTKWKDTKIRKPDPVCCIKGKYDAC